MMKVTLNSIVKDTKRNRVGKVIYLFVPFASTDVVDTVLVQFNGFKTAEWMKISALKVLERADNSQFAFIKNK